MKIKRVLGLLLVITMLFSFDVSAESAIKVELDGHPIVFDTEPIIFNGTTLVPLRAIFEALGASVEWDPSSRSVVSDLDGTTVKLTIDSKIAYKNGVVFELLAAPVIVEGRTLVPVRFISESFGLNVGWEASKRTVLINSVEMDWVTQTINTLEYKSNIVFKVDGGDLSGIRQANVKVDVGFGNREYWAFTNEYGQLVAVIAENIVLQDDGAEPVNKNGRYYDDEAKVPGTESADYDEGHVIADSLGGVSNAYNITPQDSILNRHGDQAYMEEVIRQAGGCSKFIAVITYPNTKTQIPSHYSYTYMLRGNEVKDEFDNVNPDRTAITDVVSTKPAYNVVAGSTQVKISELDKRAEYVLITNNGTNDIDISKWVIVSETGNQSLAFPSGTILKAGASFKITSGSMAGTGNFTMSNINIWNNSDSDPAVLYDANGYEIDRY